MASQRMLLSAINSNKSSNWFQVCVRSLKTSTQTFRRQSIPARYTRERRTHPDFQARWRAPTARELNKRREQIASDQILRHGQEKVVRRSDFTDWNYSAEISAFQARLGEKFDEEKLHQALKTREYLEDITIQRRKTFGIDSQNTFNEEDDQFQSEKDQLDDAILSKKDLEEIEADSNLNFSIVGSKVIEESIKGFVRSSLPFMPEEGVEAIKDYLTSDEMLSRVAYHIGTKDLILSKEYPPSRETKADVLKAIVGALSLSESALDGDGKRRAAKFVVEIIGAQLHGKDITDVWDVENPADVLKQVLSNNGKEAPEFRLLWVNGQDTILSCYHIGVYSEKELLGQSPGETVDIAKDMAARDALRKLFNYDDCSTPIPFQILKSTKSELKLTSNQSVRDWSADHVKNIVTV